MSWAADTRNMLGLNVLSDFIRGNLINSSRVVASNLHDALRGFAQDGDAGIIENQHHVPPSHETRIVGVPSIGSRFVAVTLRNTLQNRCCADGLGLCRGHAISLMPGISTSVLSELRRAGEALVLPKRSDVRSVRWHEGSALFCRIDVLGVTDEMYAESRELLKRRNENAQRAGEPIVLPNQDTIEFPASGIIH